MFLDAFSLSESESEVHLSPKNLILPLATLPCLAVTHCNPCHTPYLVLLQLELTLFNYMQYKIK